METKRKNTIICELVKELYAEWDKELWGNKTELEKQFTDKIMYENKIKSHNLDDFPQIDKTVKDEIRKWIRAKLRNDFAFLERYINPPSMECATDDEVKTLLKVMLRLRNESFDFFFGKSSEADHGLRRLNVRLGKGDLVYDYEKLYVYLLNKWNNESGYKREIKLEHYYEISLCMEGINNKKEKLIEYFFANNRMQVQVQIAAILNAYDEMCYQIKKYESYEYGEEVQAWLLRAVLFIDFILGTNRDILLMMTTFASEEVVNKIFEHYVHSVWACVAEAQKKAREGNYSLIENYLLITIMNSISNERLVWREIQQFLNNEIETEKKGVKRTSYKKTEVEPSIGKILHWFQNSSNVKLLVDNEIVRNSIYTECFLFKKPPKRMKRFGIMSFLEHMDNQEGHCKKVMTYEELFYQEKIVRGLYRERDMLERYLIQKRGVEKVYELESELLSKANMQGKYLGYWASGICEAIKEIVNEYLL